jgi:hypothetical protein
MFWPIGNIQGATRPRPYLPQKALDKLRDMPALDLDEPVVEPVHVQLHPLTLGGGWTGHCMPVAAGTASQANPLHCLAVVPCQAFSRSNPGLACGSSMS